MSKLTLRGALEIIEHEAIVREAYKDSEGIWTWGVGVTSQSGHRVERYKNNPQTLERCLEIYIWLLETKYVPDVIKAFGRHKLQEHELAAATSFHWNTGAILRADWVKSFNIGDVAAARRQFMNYSKPLTIIGRRKAERNLFFDGTWTSDGYATVFEVSKPSYQPRWSSAKQVDVRPALRAVMEKKDG